MKSYVAQHGDIEQLIDEYNLSYEKGSEDWFRYFSATATVYPIGSTEPFIGRAAYEDNFRELLKEERQVEVLKRDLQIMGDTAVVMQLLRVTQSQVVITMRESTIWKQENGGKWKIIHLHTAQAIDAAPVEAISDPRAIKVLAARLATASAQAGVAQ
jgi:ketosteroid isomerase-like protein